MLSCQYGTKTLIQLVAQVPIAIITIDVKESKPVNQSITLSRSTEPALRKQFVPSHPTIQFHFYSSPPRSQHTSLCIYLAPIELHRISLKKQVGDLISNQKRAFERIYLIWSAPHSIFFLSSGIAFNDKSRLFLLVKPLLPEAGNLLLLWEQGRSRFGLSPSFLVGYFLFLGFYQRAYYCNLKLFLPDHIFFRPQNRGGRFLLVLAWHLVKLRIILQWNAAISEKTDKAEKGRAQLSCMLFQKESRISFRKK